MHYYSIINKFTISCISADPTLATGPIGPVAPVTPIGYCGQSHIATKVSTVLDTILLVLVPVSREYE